MLSSTIFNWDSARIRFFSSLIGLVSLILNWSLVAIKMHGLTTNSMDISEAITALRMNDMLSTDLPSLLKSIGSMEKSDTKKLITKSPIKIVTVIIVEMVMAPKKRLCSQVVV